MTALQVLQVHRDERPRRRARRRSWRNCGRRLACRLFGCCGSGSREGPRGGGSGAAAAKHTTECGAERRGGRAGGELRWRAPEPVPLPPRGEVRARSPRSAVDDRRVEPRLGRPPGKGATPEAPHRVLHYRPCHRHIPGSIPRHRLSTPAAGVAVTARTHTDPGEPNAAPSGVPEGVDRGRGGAARDDGGCRIRRLLYGIGNRKASVAVDA